MPVGDVFKQGMKDAGLWTDFISVRSGLKDGGLSPKDANSQALVEFAPKLEAWLSSDKTTPQAAMPSSPPEAAFSISEGGGASAACCPDEGLPPLTPDELECLLAKSASITEAIQWVAKWLACPEKPEVKDAPSLEAYGMYESYSRTVLRQDEFWDKVFVRLVPSKAQLEQTTKVKVDGQNIMDAISRIEKIKGKVSG